MTPPAGATPDITAAGGVVVRHRDNRTEFLVVHRPRYDDWSLPKGKLEPGERFLDGARREVEEETGSKTHKLARIGSVAYRSTGKRRKVVRYWLFEHTGGKFRPNEEVDAVRWLGAADALQLLTYPRDRNVFTWASTLASSPKAGRVHLVRHARAGTRVQDRKKDRSRSLTKSGRRQAHLIEQQLSAVPVARVFSSSYARCRETVAPLASSIAEKVRDEPSLAEGASAKNLLKAVAGLAGRAAVLCSHGAEIEAFIDAVGQRGAVVEPGAGIDTEKGATWEIEITAGLVTSARYRGLPA